ncbi:fimbrial protein [Paraherbaspirillum soli]|uniref:Fimbrial protein n=1 Tax=Paraherbaspirillum soli TaxID=631222 RepID=A0ABW0MD26_9BURK
MNNTSHQVQSREASPHAICAQVVPARVAKIVIQLLAALVMTLILNSEARAGAVCVYREANYKGQSICKSVNDYGEEVEFSMPNFHVHSFSFHNVRRLYIYGRGSLGWDWFTYVSSQEYPMIIWDVSKIRIKAVGNCELTSSWTTAKRDVPLGSISVPSNTAVGATIKTVTVNMPTAGNIVTDCRDTSYPQRRTTEGKLVSGYTDVYSTNLSGIGYQIVPTSDGNGGAFTSTAEGKGFSGSYYWHGGNIEFRLIKTGPITAGTLDFKQYGYINFRTPPGYSDVQAASFNVTTGTITTPTCTMSGPATVSLGNVAASVFSGTGATSSSVDAKLSFAGCDSSLSGITFGLSGTSGDTLFPLSSDSTAKGVAIELLDKDGKTVAPAGSVDWTTTSANAQNGYGFKVRYKQTASEVVPGTANGAITINATYR